MRSTRPPLSTALHEERRDPREPGAQVHVQTAQFLRRSDRLPRWRRTGSVADGVNVDRVAFEKKAPVLTDSESTRRTTTAAPIAQRAVGRKRRRDISAYWPITQGERVRSYEPASWLALEPTMSARYPAIDVSQ